MNSRDKELVTAIRDKLKLRNKIYEYRRTPLHTRRKTYTRGDGVTLIVRDLGQLKNIIVPFCYERLKGNKGEQFLDWLEKIGNDPAVEENYRLIYRLHKSGFFRNNPKFK